jgi:hypothetical protein
MNKNQKLLQEYSTVMSDLEKIKNQIIVIKDITENKIRHAKNENEKASIFVEFKGEMDKMRQDKNMKKKYKQLQQKKNSLESSMLSEMEGKNIEYESEVSDDDHIQLDFDSISGDIISMVSKYKVSINRPIVYSQCEQSDYSDYSEESEDNMSRRFIRNNKMNNIMNEGRYEIKTSRQKLSKQIPKSKIIASNRKSKNNEPSNVSIDSDVRQMKKLSNLIESLKLEMDK